MDQGGPCGEKSCSVCNICTKGFKLMGYLGRTAKLTNVQLRYGDGLYFSSVSGKANDYAAPSEKVRPRDTTLARLKHWRWFIPGTFRITRSCELSEDANRGKTLMCNVWRLRIAYLGQRH